MNLTDQDIRRMLPNAGKRLDAHLPYIWPSMKAAEIDSPQRATAFLAELAHESGEYRYMEEIADGSAYEGRSDLGNIHPGDGVKFKGHGPIQITGRDNHHDCGLALGIDLIEDPRKLTLPEYATASSCWFWNSRRLSLLADRDWFKTITKRINGGYNGLSDRRQYWDRNRAILGLPYVDLDKEEFAIAAFQKERGLYADGIVGPRTMMALAK